MPQPSYNPGYSNSVCNAPKPTAVLSEVVDTPIPLEAFFFNKYVKTIKQMKFQGQSTTNGNLMLDLALDSGTFALLKNAKPIEHELVLACVPAATTGKVAYPKYCNIHVNGNFVKVLEY